MYDELVKRLRLLAKVYSICENENTEEYKLAVEAANALEEYERKSKFNLFVWETLGHSRMRQLIEMYHQFDEDNDDKQQ